MSTYDEATYELSFYGPDSPASFLTTLQQHTSADGSIVLTWQTPSNNSWRHIRLVRNAFGYPVNQDDGVILVDVNAGPGAVNTLDPPVTSYVDHDVSAPSFYYYSLFVSTSTTGTISWSRCSDLTAAAVSDRGSSKYLLDRLPTVYTNSLGAVDEETDEVLPISRFLKIFGSDLNRIKDFANGLNSVSDPDTVHGSMLPYLVQQYGFTYEPLVGMRQNRVIAQNAFFLNAVKGTEIGITAFATALTSYDSYILPWKNQLLTVDQASFEGSGGGWYTGTTAWPNTNSVFLAGGTETTSKGALAITAPTNGPITITTQGGPNTAYYSGMPVVAGMPYTLSAYFLSASTSVSPTFEVHWYDINGVALSASTGTTTGATNTSTWVQLQLATTAPAGAAFAFPYINYPWLLNTDVQYVDHVQFEQSTTATTFEPARLISLVLVAPRINEALNSGFDTDVTNWTLTGTGASIAQDTATTYNFGAGSAKITLPSGSTGASLAQTVSFDEGERYTFAAQVRSSYLTTITLQVTWEAVSGTPSVTSVPITLQPGVWTKVSFPVSPPASTMVGYGEGGYGEGSYGASTTPTAQISFVLPAITGAPSTRTVNIDDVQFEKSATIKQYFDGQLNGADVIYDGGDQDGRMQLYPKLGSRIAVLAQLLREYIPFDRPFQVLYGLSRVGEVTGASALTITFLGSGAYAISGSGIIVFGDGTEEIDGSAVASGGGGTYTITG